MVFDKRAYEVPDIPDLGHDLEVTTLTTSEFQDVMAARLFATFTPLVFGGGPEFIARLGCWYQGRPERHH
jgi:hypothetical protein